MFLQKEISKNIVVKLTFCCLLDLEWVPDPLARGADPQIRIRNRYQNVMDHPRYCEKESLAMNLTLIRMTKDEKVLAIFKGLLL
jgi:hypothetical protein